MEREDQQRDAELAVVLPAWDAFTFVVLVALALAEQWADLLAAVTALAAARAVLRLR